MGIQWQDYRYYEQKEIVTHDYNENTILYVLYEKGIAAGALGGRVMRRYEIRSQVCFYI